MAGCRGYEKVKCSNVGVLLHRVLIKRINVPVFTDL